MAKNKGYSTLKYILTDEDREDIENKLKELSAYNYVLTDVENKPMCLTVSYEYAAELVNDEEDKTYYYFSSIPEYLDQFVYDKTDVNDEYADFADFDGQNDTDNEEYDVVKNPSHYCFGEYQPKDVIRDWDLNFNLGNAVKYIARAGKKDDIIQDLSKAKQYIEFEIEYLSKNK